MMRVTFLFHAGNFFEYDYGVLCFFLPKYHCVKFFLLYFTKKHIYYGVFLAQYNKEKFGDFFNEKLFSVCSYCGDCRKYCF